LPLLEAVLTGFGEAPTRVPAARAVLEDVTPESMPGVPRSAKIER
jgi:hypothetical protein